MMTKKRMWAGVALSVALLLSGCGKGTGEAPVPPDTEEFVTAGPADTEPETEDPIDYGALSRNLFDGLTESPESDFTTVANADGVTVTGYTGQDEKIRIPDRIGGSPVTALADGALRGNETVKVLWIPDSVTGFGSGILVGTSSLYALHTPIPQEEGKQFLGWLFGAESYETNNVVDLRRIDFLEIGGTQTELPAYALFDCNDLVTVRLPETVTTLENWSLARCSSLKQIDLTGIIKIGEGALLGCSALTAITLSDRLEQVGREAFSDCNGIRSMQLPFIGESRTQNRFLGWLFGAETPQQATGLYPSKLRAVVLTDETAVGDYAFYAAPVRTVTLTDGVTGIGVRAFGNCEKLSRLTLPSGVLTIGEHAFSGCASLLEIRIPDGVTGIGVNAFLNCTALESVTLPQTVKSLPSGCFFGCRNLREVDLGGVGAVGVNAFRGCDALETLLTNGSASFADGNASAENRISGD